MYRIKYLLGSMVTIFSVVYFLFGGSGWYRGDASFQDVLTCMVLASLHMCGGGWLLVSSLKDFRAERSRVDCLVRHLIRTNGGRVVVGDLARYAEISEDDARDHLERRSQRDVAFVAQGRNGYDVYYFGQQYWYN
mgnify:FL=1